MLTPEVRLLQNDNDALLMKIIVHAARLNVVYMPLGVDLISLA